MPRISADMAVPGEGEGTRADEPRIHDILAVHGVGEQRRGDTLADFAEHFYKGVRRAVLEQGHDPNEQVRLVSNYQQGYVEVYCANELFRLREVSWAHSFKVPGAREVLTWLWQWSSLYLYQAWALWRKEDQKVSARGPVPRWTWLLFFVMLDLTLIAPLMIALWWWWAARRYVVYQQRQDVVDLNDAGYRKVLKDYRLATGVALATSVPLLVALQALARLGRAAAVLPLVGDLTARMAATIEHSVVGSFGDIMLYVFDSVQASFVRGELEQAIKDACRRAEQENPAREPRIHVIGHSMGSVIAYEVLSYSLEPGMRARVETLCTMGTVMDMIRHVLNSGGLVLAERVRLGQDIPRQDEYPCWINFYAYNDPATRGPLNEFNDHPPTADRRVRSTPKGHSTYWSDVQGVYRSFLARIVPDNPLFAERTPSPPADGRTATSMLVQGLWVALLVVAIVAWWDWYLVQYLAQRLFYLWLLWLIVLLVPTSLQVGWRRLEYRLRVDQGGGLRRAEQSSIPDYWVDTLDGIGPDYVLALRKKGIWNLRDFLVVLARPSGPGWVPDFVAVPGGGLKWVAGILDAPEEQVERWARQANLMRLHGVGPKRAKLLLAAGVDSLTALSQQERGALMERMVPLVKEVGLHRLPSGRQVKQWIEQAKTLKDVI